MKTIYVTCVAGWGNRLNPLVSALRIADRFGYDVKVLWGNQAWFPVEFNDVFENDMSVGDYDEVRRIESSPMRQFVDHVDPNQTGWVIPFRPTNEDVLWKTYKVVLADDEWHDGIRNTGHIPRSIGTEFAAYHSRLIPTKEIRNGIATLRVGRSTVGIHVRKPEVLRQPGGKPDYRWHRDADLHKQIDQLAADRPLFLSSDCKPTQNRFIKRYGDRITFFAKSERPLFWDWDDAYNWCFNIRSSKTAIREAFVDITGLSRCGYIIRNHPSTFSSYARLIGRIEANYD